MRLLLGTRPSIGRVRPSTLGRLGIKALKEISRLVRDQRYLGCMVSSRRYTIRQCLMAFGAALPSIVLAQWVAKVVGGMVWALVIARIGSSMKSRPA